MIMTKYKFFRSKNNYREWGNKQVCKTKGCNNVARIKGFCTLCYSSHHRKKRMEKEWCVTHMRNCIDCGSDISYRGNRSIRCEECQKIATRDNINSWKREHRYKKTPDQRFCLTCGMDISDTHYHTEFCKKCSKDNIRESHKKYYQKNKTMLNETHKRYYQKNKERIKKREKLKVREYPNFCRRCGVLISHLHAKKLYCDECSVIRRRITHKNASRKFLEQHPERRREHLERYSEKNKRRKRIRGCLQKIYIKKREH